MTSADRLVVFVAKSISFASRLFHFGAGATWPGEIALWLRPNILRSFSDQNIHVIVVCGTNGKTTTVKMIETIFKKNARKVVLNSSGANLDNGVVSAFISCAGWNGTLRATHFAFEVDEAAFPLVLRSMVPQYVVLLNLFRDQLDRYGEVDSVAEKWLTALKTLPQSAHVLVNGDDPHLAYLGSQLKTHVSYFGLENPDLFLSKMQHATDSIYCPKCGNRLTFGGVYFSHLGKYACGQCNFSHPDVDLTAKDVSMSLAGVYNLYNVLAATLVANIEGISKKDTEEALKTFVPAFGRMETVQYRGKNIRILLSKNPTGFNESLRTYLATQKHGPLLIVLNDRIPDGTDVSWIWDVDFEVLADTGDKSAIIVSGDRCYDMGLRLHYAGVKKERMKISTQLADAVMSAIDRTEEKETLWVVPTYSAMLDVRRILVGRKIL